MSTSPHGNSSITSRKKRPLTVKDKLMSKEEMIAPPAIPSASPVSVTRYNIQQSRGRNVSLKPVNDDRHSPRKVYNSRQRVFKNPSKSPTPPIGRTRSSQLASARSKSIELKEGNKDNELLLKSEIDMLKSQISILQAKVIREKAKRQACNREITKQKDIITQFSQDIQDLVGLIGDTVTQLQEQKPNSNSFETTKSRLFTKISDISFRIPELTQIIDQISQKSVHHKRSGAGYTFSTLIEHCQELNPNGTGEFTTGRKESQYFTMNDTFSSAKELSKEVDEDNKLV